jgi:integrase
MAKKLTDRAVRAHKQGVLADAATPGLRVVATGGRAPRYVYRYQREGRRRDLSLGAASRISLAEARRLADEAYKLLLAGVDPIEHRRQALKPKTPQHRPTFGEVAEQAIAARAGAITGKQADAWRSTLTNHAAGLTDTPIEDINLDQIVTAVLPCWREHPVTGRHLITRVETVIDHATAHGLRSGDNPARWKLIRARLPAVKHVPRNMPAASWRQGPEICRALFELGEPVADLILVAVLTASRQGMVRGMTQSELDWDALLWRVPANRMKASRAHEVPITPWVETIIRRQPDQGELVFPGPRFGDRPLTSAAPVRLLRRLGIEGVTVHGFRSTFRDWATEQTGADWDVIEQQLAHSLGNRAQQAYDRSRRLPARRTLMEAWERHCLGEAPSGAFEVALASEDMSEDADLEVAYQVPRVELVHG